jgi:hypothetical protein
MESNPPNQEGSPAKEHSFDGVITIVMPKEAGGKTENPRLKYFELTVSLIKAGAWPLLALIVLWSLRVPIGTIAHKLPDMIASADSVKFSAGTAGVAVELQRAAQAAARAAGRPELAQSIGDLSPAAIAELIRENMSRQIIVGNGAQPQLYTLPTDEQFKVIFELEKKGLVEFGPLPLEQFDSFVKNPPFQVEDTSGERKVYRATRPLTPAEELKLNAEYYRLTKAGEQVYHYIVDSIIQESKPNTPGAK